MDEQGKGACEGGACVQDRPATKPEGFAVVFPFRPGVMVRTPVGDVGFLHGVYAHHDGTRQGSVTVKGGASTWWDLGQLQAVEDGAPAAPAATTLGPRL